MQVNAFIPPGLIGIPLRHCESNIVLNIPATASLTSLGGVGGIGAVMSCLDSRSWRLWNRNPWWMVMSSFGFSDS